MGLYFARRENSTDGGELRRFIAEHDRQLLNNPASEHGLALIQTPVPHTGPDSGVAVVKQAKILQTSGLFRFAEPDYLVSTEDTQPDDQALSNGWLWGLRNTGQWGGTADLDIAAVEKQMAFSSPPARTT